MKAIILAGGLGSRLGELTTAIPKSLLLLGKKTLLDYQLALLARYGISEVAILTSYLSDRIHAHCSNGRFAGLKIHCINDIELRGTAGALCCASSFVGNGKFLVMSGDVLTNLDIQKFISWHDARDNSLATFVVQRIPYRSDADFVELDASHRIQQVIVRPHLDKIGSMPMSIASVYIFSSRVFDFIPLDQKTDIERDIMPQLINNKVKIYGYVTNEYMKDIGTPERLKEARNDVAQPRSLFVFQ